MSERYKITMALLQGKISLKNALNIEAKKFMRKTRQTKSRRHIGASKFRRD